MSHLSLGLGHTQDDAVQEGCMVKCFLGREGLATVSGNLLTPVVLTQVQQCPPQPAIAIHIWISGRNEAK